MLTAQQALTKANETKQWAIGMCDNFVANMFGYTSSGYPTAASHWGSIPSGDKHPGDMQAPAGALMFWGGGAGHVAISDGSGGIFTTDYPTSGMVSHVQATVISGSWGKPYLGWSVPVFQGQVGNVARDASYSIPGVGSLPGAGAVTDALGGGFLSGLVSGFGGDVKDLAERGALMLLGWILLLVGVIEFVGGRGKIKASMGGKGEGESKTGDEGGGDGDGETT